MTSFMNGLLPFFLGIIETKQFFKIFYNLMYLYNKNILEYAQIVVTHANSRIFDIEGQST